MRCVLEDGSSVGTSAPRPVRRRILVVEEEPDVRLLSRLALEAVGHTVAVADDAETGLRMLAGDARRFDAMVLSVESSEASGVDLADLATSLHESIPIIASSRRPERRRPRHAAWLWKPYAAQDLVFVVETLTAAEIDADAGALKP